MENEVKKCEHCGNDGELETVRTSAGKQYAYKCKYCRCGTPFCSEEAEARKKWNERISSDTISKSEVIDYLNKNLLSYEVIRDGWKPDSSQYATYDLVCRQIKKDIEKISILQQTPSRPSQEVETIKDEIILEFMQLLGDGILVRNTEHDEDFQKFTADALRITTLIGRANVIYENQSPPSDSGEKGIDK